MKRVKVLAFLSVAALVAALVLVLVIPATTMAQAPSLPHRFYGTATVDGIVAADGTEVVAAVETQTFPTTITGGSYRIDVRQPEGQSFTGKTVTFTVKGLPAAQTGLWAAGDLTAINLTAPAQQVSPTPGVTPGVTPTVAATPTRAPTTPTVAPTVAGTPRPTTPVLTTPVPGQTPVAVAGPKGDTGPQGPRGPAGGGGAIPWIALVVGVVGLLAGIGAMITGRTHSHIP